jgi:hypothetical protein
MPQGKGTYGSKVGRPPKKAASKKVGRSSLKPAGPKKAATKKPAAKKPTLKKKSGFAAIDEKLSKFATGGPIRRGLTKFGKKITVTGHLEKRAEAKAKTAAKAKAEAKKKSVGTKTTVRGGKVAKVVRGGKTTYVGYGRQSQSTKQKPQSGVKRVTPKPIAPKNQKAKGRAIAKNASKPRAVAKPKAKPRTRART